MHTPQRTRIFRPQHTCPKSQRRSEKWNSFVRLMTMIVCPTKFVFRINREYFLSSSRSFADFNDFQKERFCSLYFSALNKSPCQKNHESECVFILWSQHLTCEFH